MREYLARVGAVAAIGGALTLLIGTLLHPMQADPNNSVEAFAEYAADRMWVASHLLQFVGVAGFGAALVALAGITEIGRASVWAWIGVFWAASAVAAAAALQAVDGVALKVMVDRWAAAWGTRQSTTLAVRQIEVGFASLFSIVFALAVLAFSMSIFLSGRFVNSLGTLGLIGGAGTLASGIAQAYTGFSSLAMGISMSASSLLLLWAIAIGVVMWRLAPQLRTTDAVSEQPL